MFSNVKELKDNDFVKFEGDENIYRFHEKGEGFILECVQEANSGLKVKRGETFSYYDKNCCPWKLNVLSAQLQWLRKGDQFEIVIDKIKGHDIIYEMLEDYNPHFKVIQNTDGYTNGTEYNFKEFSDWFDINVILVQKKKEENMAAITSSAKGKVLTFNYEGGSNPGARRYVYVQEVTSTNIGGLDLQDGGAYKCFVKNKIKEQSVVPHQTLDVSGLPSTVKGYTLLNGYHIDGYLAVLVDNKIHYMKAPKHKTFADIKVGDAFRYNGVGYRKVESVGTTYNAYTLRTPPTLTTITNSALVD